MYFLVFIILLVFTDFRHQISDHKDLNKYYFFKSNLKSDVLQSDSII